MRRSITSEVATLGNSERGRDAARRSIRAIRRYPFLTAIIVMMAVTLIAGLATGFDLAMRLNYALAILIFVSWFWSKYGASQITARAERPQGPFSVGDTLVERITIRNSGAAPKAWVEIEDKTDLPDISFREVTSLGLMVTFKSINMSGELTQRGEFDLGPLVLRTSDPFGIFRREIEFEGVEQLLVYPKIEQLPNFASTYIHMVGDSSRRQRLNVLSTDVSSVREYTDGDPIGRIHWLTTARTGNLMVKQFDQGSAGELWVLFDQHKDSQAGEGKESTDEYGATIAASAINRYTGNFMPVGFAGFGSRSLIALPEHSSVHRDQIMRHIAASKPVGEVPLIDAIAEIDHELYVSSTLVLITAAQDGEWIEALETLQKRGTRVIAILIDRESFGGETNADALARLTAAGITAFRVKNGDNIRDALRSPIDADTLYPTAPHETHIDSDDQEDDEQLAAIATGARAK